jgi:hypothetical protein
VCIFLSQNFFEKRKNTKITKSHQNTVLLAQPEQLDSQLEKPHYRKMQEKEKTVISRKPCEGRIFFWFKKMSKWRN